MTAHPTHSAAPTQTGAFRFTTGLLAGVLLGYFLLPQMAPRGWTQPAEDSTRRAFLAQFTTRDEAVTWLSDTADSLDRKTGYLAKLSPPPLERREVDQIRGHLKLLNDNPTRKVDSELMWRARALSEQLVGVPEPQSHTAQTPVPASASQPTQHPPPGRQTFVLPRESR